MEKRRKPRALLSVYDKELLEPFAKVLAKSGYEIIASGGTAQFLKRINIDIVPLESVTGNPEAFQGRMKTLSFQLESAILFDRENLTQQQEAKKLGIIPIDIVVCNFYPFEKALQERLPINEAIELIDVGGPTMVRAAAKNFKNVVVLVDPEDYPRVADYIKSKKEIPIQEKLNLAAKAFKVTADYDSQIDIYFRQEMNERVIRPRFHGGEKLRYGENPHQQGFVFWSNGDDKLSLSNFTKVSGKNLSFNNLLDADAAINTLTALGGEKPACVIIKHNNPCGVAMAQTIEEAFHKAWEGDPVASFGGIIALNRGITSALVDTFLEEKKFVELFIAPTLEKKALAQLAEKKKNLIILVNPSLNSPTPNTEMDIKKIRGGLLVQEVNNHLPTSEDLEVVSQRLPKSEEVRDLLFAWKIARESKSNSIILAHNEQMVGSGIGQQDRVRACRLAVEKAGGRARGACAVSDGFFPFPDGPQVLIDAGITAILHPGGSIRDEETIKLCNEHQVALLTTKGIRAFKH